MGSTFRSNQDKQYGINIFLIILDYRVGDTNHITKTWIVTDIYYYEGKTRFCVPQAEYHASDLINCLLRARPPPGLLLNETLHHAGDVPE